MESINIKDSRFMSQKVKVLIRWPVIHNTNKSGIWQHNVWVKLQIWRFKWDILWF
jgi:hypothetical protein